MPYVKQEAYERVLGETGPRNAGELNFMFTRIAIQYLQTMGLNYQHINDIVGALEGAKAELQRRVVAPYENVKIMQNGDVYPATLIDTATRS